MTTLPPHADDSNPFERRCTGPCDRLLPATTEYFSRMTRSKDGLKRQCKECLKVKQQAHNQLPEVREHRRVYKKARYHEVPEVREQHLAKQNARYRQLEVHERYLAQMKEYRNRPEVQDRQRSYQEQYQQRSYVRIKNRDRSKEYRLRPDVQEQSRAYSKAHRRLPEIQERDHAYRLDYNSRPYAREQKRIWTETYQSLPETKERARLAQHRRRARKKAIPGTYTVQQIQEQLKRQRYRCYYCSQHFDKAKGKYIYHIDHTFPLSRVNADIPANDISYLVMACPRCNVSKGDKFPWEWHQGGRLL